MGFSLGRRGLVDECHVSGPPRSGKACSAPSTLATAQAAGVVIEVSFHGYVRSIAIDGRCLIGGVGYSLLPRWDRNRIRTHASSAVPPGRLGSPLAARAAGHQIRSPHRGNVGVLAWEIGVKENRVTAIVARGGKDALPLRGHLLKEKIVRLEFVRSPRPRDAYLIGGVVGGNLGEDVHVRLADIDVHVAQARRHSDRLCDIKSLFRVVGPC